MLFHIADSGYLQYAEAYSFTSPSLHSSYYNSLALLFTFSARASI